MPTKIVVPELGESIVEATVSRWLKQEGDQVKVGEPLLELETDKVNLEVGAEHAGVLVSIERQEGEDVEVGEVLAMLEEGEAETEEAGEAQATGEEDTTAEEAEPGGKENGQAGDDEASKAAEASRAERNGAQSAQTEAAEEETKPKAEAQSETDLRAQATPSARRLAREKGLDLAQVAAEHAGPRLTRQDIQTYLQPDETRPAKKSEPADSTPARDKREERVRLSRRRQTIARRLVEAQQTAAMLTTFNEVNMSAVMAFRQRHQETFQKRHGIKLGISSFFVKASIGALKDFPQLNAEIQENEIVLKHYYDIGIAIGAEEGLVVPVLRDADRLSFAQIEQTIKDYAQQAQENTLSLEDLQGGTFTITNGGVFGSLLSTPILNPPQVGILGLHKIESRPIAHNDEIVIQPMMYVALSYDHRIVDGREAVQFLVRIKELIEDPDVLLLAG